MAVSWRGSLAAAAFALLVAATFWGLERSARLEFASHLRERAADALALAASGSTPYQWRLRSADELVAGHPFGSPRFEFVDQGLRVSGAGHPVEIGLTHSGSVDLQHFPLLRISLDSALPGNLRLVIRQTAHAPELVSSAVAFPAGTSEVLSVDLDDLDWASSDVPAPAPKRAAMLRLRLGPQPQAATLLRGVSLNRPANYMPIDLGAPLHIVGIGTTPPSPGLTILRLPDDPLSLQAGLRALAAGRGSSAAPLLFALPQSPRVERQMILRNAVHAVLPDAILVPEGKSAETLARARELAAAGPHARKASTQWPIAALFALAFLLGRLYPPRNARRRALLEIVLTMAPPLWLVLGGNTSGNLHAPQQAVIGMLIVYAVSLSFPRHWHWIGAARSWWYATAVVALALAIGLAAHHADGSIIPAPDFRHVVRYILWALLQQYLICVICTERWNIATGSPLAATYLGALGFALLHTPNPTLMLATFAGGLCWCAIYLRYRALLPLAVSHAASALLLSAMLPAAILHSAEVSVRFFQ
jgi:hypothetical protein